MIHNIDDFPISILIAISKHFNHSELIHWFNLGMYWFNHIYDCQLNFKIIILIVVPSKSLNVKNNRLLIEYTHFLHSIDIFIFRVTNDHDGKQIAVLISDFQIKWLNHLSISMGYQPYSIHNVFINYMHSIISISHWLEINTSNTCSHCRYWESGIS